MEKSAKAVSEASPFRDIAAQYPVGQWMAMNAVARHGVSIALACRAFEISETCYRYSPVLSDENEEIADWLERLTANKRSWGFGLCFLYLRNVQGYGWNHKRVYRIYCALELNLRIKPKKRLKRDKPEPLAAWTCPAYVPVSQLIFAAFRSNAKGLLPPSDECLRLGL